MLKDNRALSLIPQSGMNLVMKITVCGKFRINLSTNIGNLDV